MKPKKIDWKKVKVDTPIVVERTVFEKEMRHFAYFKNDTVWTWSHGRTSWTTIDKEDVLDWPYARLPTKKELAAWKARRG